MNSRTWIVLLALLCWGIISWYWYTCKIKGFCGNEIHTEQQVEPEEKQVAEVEYGPLTFNWKGQEALTTNKWGGYMNGIITRGSEGQLLVISGPYYTDEVAPPGFDNMGLARASRVRDLLAGKLDAERIELSSHSLGNRDPATIRFGDARLKWVTRNENVQETMDGALIYFPYNSDKKISNPNIEAYLNTLANNLKENGGSISVIGHTDNAGSAEYNKSLGMERAISVKQTLMSRGVDASKISTSSMGEAQPIASNDTESGQRKNRRTEIIIKN